VESGVTPLGTAWYRTGSRTIFCSAFSRLRFVSSRHCTQPAGNGSHADADADAAACAAVSGISNSAVPARTALASFYVNFIYFVKQPTR
jgi:hypothetical protein